MDEKQRVIGAKGKKPVLVNTSPEALQAFLGQIQVSDLIGCEDPLVIRGEILRLTEELQQRKTTRPMQPHREVPAIPVEVVMAKEKAPDSVKLDRAGYFVILPKSEQALIFVEHFSNSNKLLRIIQGNNARDIYWTIIDNGWVTEMSHAAYLGKELAIAEAALRQGSKYIQDKA